MQTPARLHLVLSALALATLVVTFPRPHGTGDADSSADKGEPALVMDAPLATHRIELLAMAFEAVSDMPDFPHIKNRSRIQERVVEACLELDQPQRALKYLEQIANWRRGAALAAYVTYQAEHGATVDLAPLLERAEVSIAELEREESQAWRRDRIRAGIACALHALGRPTEAAAYEAGLDPAEAASLAPLRAANATLEDFEAHLAAADEIALGGNYDQIRNALATCAQLYDRFWDERELRDRAAAKIKACWSTLPLQIRIELLMELARMSLEHGDQDEALDFVVEARAFLDAARWLPEHHVPLASRLAALRHGCGETAEARAEIEAEQTLYADSRETIVDIYRADALLPLAEAWVSMGDDVQALATWRLALDEGAHNPNSRPQAEDLVALCLSMAREGVEPDEEFRERAQEILGSLGDPW